jgi:hypothetical protein
MATTKQIAEMQTWLAENLMIEITVDNADYRSHLKVHVKLKFRGDDKPFTQASATLPKPESSSEDY